MLPGLSYFQISARFPYHSQAFRAGISMITGYRVKQWLKNVLRKPLRNLGWLLIRVELNAMRTANRGLPFVSIEHDRLYPPKNSCASTVDWISQFGRKMQADIQLVDATYIAVNKA